MVLAFKPEVLKEFEGIAAHYPVRRAALLPALWLAQREFGWISEEAMKCVATLMDVSPVQVLEVVNFYTMFQKQKPGKYHLQVCRTLSCLLNGSEQIQAKIEEVLKLKPGEITPDGQFSYQTAECLASCHTGPCMRVNEENHENLTVDKVEKLIEKLGEKEF